MSGTAGSSGRKRLHRRPGYMRGEQSRLQSATYGREEEEEEEEERRTTCIRNGKSGRHADITDATSGQSLTPAVRVSLMNQQQPGNLTCSSFLCSVTRPLHPVECSPINGTSSYRGQSSVAHSELRLNPALQSSPQETFNSSFSFIQQSLSSSQRTDTTIATPARQTEPLKQPTKPPSSPQTTQATLHTDVSKHSAAIQSLSSSTAGSQAEKENLSLGGRFWRECPWSAREAMSNQPDHDSRFLDIEITSSLSVDSDTASASSVTSGYESATPASDQGWDNLTKKYEGVLQDCLQNNRTHTKVGRQMQDCGHNRLSQSVQDWVQIKISPLMK